MKRERKTTPIHQSQRPLEVNDKHVFNICGVKMILVNVPLIGVWRIEQNNINRQATQVQGNGKENFKRFKGEKFVKMLTTRNPVHLEDILL